MMPSPSTVPTVPPPTTPISAGIDWHSSDLDRPAVATVTLLLNVHCTVSIMPKLSAKQDTLKQFVPYIQILPSLYKTHRFEVYTVYGLKDNTDELV